MQNGVMICHREWHIARRERFAKRHRWREVIADAPFIVGSLFRRVRSRRTQRRSLAIRGRYFPTTLAVLTHRCTPSVRSMENNNSRLCGTDRVSAQRVRVVNGLARVYGASEAHAFRARREASPIGLFSIRREYVTSLCERSAVTHR